MKGSCFVQLTERDRKTISALFRNTIMSFEQLKEIYFPMCSAPTMSTRMSALERAGFVRKHRVGLYSFYGRRPVNVIYTVGERAISILESENVNQNLHIGIPVVNYANLAHDVELGWLLEAWGALAYNSRLLKQPCRLNVQQPDAVTFDSKGQLHAAIELELTAKSNKRIEDILFHYRCQMEFKEVHFVCRDLNIFNKYKNITDKLRITNSHSQLNILPTFHVHMLDAFLPKGPTAISQVNVPSHTEERSIAV